MQVQLEYYRLGQGYRSCSTYETEKHTMADIRAEVQVMRAKKRLPGLPRQHPYYMVRISVQDLPSCKSLYLL